MKIVRRSYFKKPLVHKAFFKNWVEVLEKMNGYVYDKISIPTSLGLTQVYGLHADKKDRETLLIFPGFRTTALLWDLDRGLLPLAKEFRIFLVETNGQPNLSEGNTPSIKSLDYGYWGEEVLNGLGTERAFIAGASMGGLVCMKMAICIPQRIKGAILLNPACFRYVSLRPKNLYYNLLPILNPTKTSISHFLDAVVFNTEEKAISHHAEQHLIDFLLFAIQSYKDHTQKPYYMGSQLDKVEVEVFLILGSQDILLPYQKTLRNARKHLGNNLKEVRIENYGHGIELCPKAIAHLGNFLKRSNR